MNEDALQAALQRLIDGTASPEDRAVIQSARAEGRLTLASGERSMAVGRDAKGSIFVSGDLSLTAEVLDHLLEENYQLPALAPEGQLPPPGRLPPGSRLPFTRNAVFVGREADLLGLAKALLYQPEEDGITGVGITQVATGMGGLGKTQLAVEFCFRYGRFFQGVHWVQANQDIPAEIAACGAAMAIQPWPEKQPDQVEATLREWGMGERRLVIFDNLEDPHVLEEWLPRLGSARLLVTARRARWPRSLGVQSLPLGTLSRAESRELLRRLADRLQQVPDAEVDQIAERLGNLPLALSVAGQYLEVRGGLSVEGYLAELEQAGGALKHLPLPEWLRDSPTRHELELWATFVLSWRELEGEAPERVKARQILQTSGYCAPNVLIPRVLLIRAIVNEEDNTGLTFDLGLRRLFELGLLTEGTEGVNIHTLLAEFGRAQNVQAQMVGGQSALEGLVEALIEQGEAANQSGLPENFKPLRAHLAQVARVAETTGMQKAGRLWNALAWHMRDVAEYTDAKSTYERALALHERVFGPEHGEVATVSNNLGGVLQALGDLPGAKAACERALAIDEKVYGPEHPDVARDVNNLGLVLQDLGDLPGAKAAYERALAIGEKFYGPEHPNVAIIVNNLGSVLQDLGDLPGAKAALERALTIFIKFLPPDHPDISTVKANLQYLTKKIPGR